jgi:trk system potassium uptake protein TrkH
VIGLVVATSAIDFAVGLRGNFSIAATAVASLLVVPWVFVALERGDASGRGAMTRRLVFHLANAALVLAFAAAKWLVVIRALGDPSGHLSGSYRSYTAALVVLMVLGVVLRGGRVARLLAASAAQPARVMATTFGLASLLGALLLALPVCLRDVSSVSLLDSLFMSTSAVCVTGLTTVDVAGTYSLVGQIVLCLLMQIGGLGIMVLTAAVTLMAGRRLGVKSSAQLAEVIDAASFADLKRQVRVIFACTIGLELVGALLLYAQLASRDPSEFAVGAAGGLGGAESAAWAAVFHSVSAFTNASLSNFQRGAAPFAHEPLFQQTLAALIVLGGAGFPILDEIVTKTVARLRRRRPSRTSLNTRVAAATGGALLLALAVVTLGLESGTTLRELGLVEKLSASVFHSACARTSGFSVVDVGAMRPATLLATMFAMFIGGSPGSTAGGIKTTTLAAIFASFRGELRGARARLFDRALPDGVVRRAMGVSFLSVAFVALVVFVLTLSEGKDTLSIAFEVVSAFSTTGLSTGITPGLSITGKLVIAATMLIGRIGPLTFALALSAKAKPPTHQLAEERVMIG